MACGYKQVGVIMYGAKETAVESVQAMADRKQRKRAMRAAYDSQ